MDTALFYGFAVAYTGLLVWGCVLAARHGWLSAANLPLLVLAGLIYDNAVIASGQLIGEGPVLEGLSFARFWIHAVATPTLVVWAWHAAKRSGAGWARGRPAALVAWGAAAALVVLEYVTVLHGLRIEPNTEYGVLSYSNADGAGGPPLMVLFVAAALLVASVVVWKRQKWVWLFVGTVLMLVGSAVPIPVESGAVTNAFELVLLVSIMATKAMQDAREKQSRF